MSLWENKRSYIFGDTQVLVTLARESDPVNYYLEVHKQGAYLNSHGSNLPFMWMAVLWVYFKSKFQKDN